MLSYDAPDGANIGLERLRREAAKARLCLVQQAVLQPAASTLASVRARQLS